MGVAKWTVFRDAKPFPFEGAGVVETFALSGCVRSVFSKTSL